MKAYLRSIKKVKLITTVLSLVVNLALHAQTADSKEAQVKAVFLFNFTQFVEWPASSFSDSKTPLIIGVLGDDPFGTFLEQTIQNEKINNHPLVIQHYHNVEEIKTCHILFINFSNKEQLEQIFKTLNGRNILTVGDTRNFILKGGMIRFFTDDDKIKFQINPEAAKEANLVISSKLLRLAEIITPKNN